MVALFVVLASLPVLAAEEETTTFDGFYRWQAQDLSGDLEAVFTKTGETTWDVSFHFNFRGPHTYAGTAEGSLRSGKLEGTVKNERGNRTFFFRGTVKKGKFRGTHFETTGGPRRQTGTLSMKVSK